MSNGPKRKLAAIMFTDIVGFSKIMGDNETKALTILEIQETLLNPIFNHYHANVIKRTGDGYLIEFDSSVEAVKCAIDMQNKIKDSNQKEENNSFHIRIGIHLGDVVVVGQDILGDGVNIASRIEPLANPDGICLTEVVYQSVKSKIDIKPRRISQVELKHIDDKYTIYKIPNEAEEDDFKKLEEPQPYFSKIKAKILNFKYMSSGLRSFITTLLYFYIIIIFGYLVGFLAGGIGPDTNLLSLLLKVLTKPVPAKVIIPFILITSLLSYLIRQRQLKIVFDDIRDVENILGMLVANMGYAFVSQEGRSVEYTYNFSEPEFITKLKLKIAWMRKMDSLVMQVNGNTLIIDGRSQSLNRLLKTFKNYTNI